MINSFCGEVLPETVSIVLAVLSGVFWTKITQNKQINFQKAKYEFQKWRAIRANVGSVGGVGCVLAWVAWVACLRG